MMKRWLPFVRAAERTDGWIARLRGRAAPVGKKNDPGAKAPCPAKPAAEATGTFVRKLDAGWIRSELPKVAPDAKISKIGRAHV